MFEDVLRFWLDRGVDGFRVDVAHGLYKEASPARPGAARGRAADVRPGQHRPLDGRAASSRTSRCGTSPRSTTSTAAGAKVLDEYGGDRMAVAEAWTQTAGVDGARSSAPDELDQAFNFAWLLADWSADGLRRGHHRHPRRRRARRRVARPGCCATTTSSATPPATAAARSGLARARAATLAMLALPGVVVPLPGRGARPRAGRRRRREHRQDPSWFRTGEVGRDGCRVPMPVGRRRAAVRLRAGRRRSRGSRSRTTGPASPSRPRRAEPGSTLEFYRAALAARRDVRCRRRRRASRCSTARRRRARLHARRRHGGAQLRRRRRCRCPPGEVLIASGAGRRRAARRTPRSGCADPISSTSLEGWRCSGRAVATKRVELVVGPVAEPARRAHSRRVGRRRSAIRRAALVGGADEQLARPSSGSGVRLDQAELDEVLDLAADRALVDVERLDDGRGRATGPLSSM